MSNEAPSPKKLPAFVLGTIFIGVPIGVLVWWAFQIQDAKKGAMLAGAVAFSLGLLSAYVHPKKTEKILSYFLTLLNP